MIDVPDIELDPLLPGESVAPRHHGQACDPGPNLEPSPLPRVVLLDLIREGRPRPDETHVAPEDVHELRKLVEPEVAQDASHARDPFVAHGDRDPETLRDRIDDHRAEFPHAEPPPG